MSHPDPTKTYDDEKDEPTEEQEVWGEIMHDEITNHD